MYLNGKIYKQRKWNIIIDVINNQLQSNLDYNKKGFEDRINFRLNDGVS